MFRSTLIAVLAAILAVGCAARTPVLPDSSPSSAALQASGLTPQASHDSHRLWGEWRFFINATHDQVDVIPQRIGRFHLNSLKFLEEYCADCLKITNIHNNGDGTIDLTVRITHPFPGHPEFTGFDVKGIIMFNGSHELCWLSGNFFPYMKHVWLSWRKLGDPEVLNPDGYTPRWCPTWKPVSDMPIFKYWPGKYSKGTPTANVNAFLNFYTDEERHMFRVDSWVEQTYHIWLPPGPVVAGYAVDACWEPPMVTPVTDPASDFPYSANQPEPYYLSLVVNKNEPITHEPCCGDWDGDCSDIWVESEVWYGEKQGGYTISILPDGYIHWGELLDCLPGTAPDDTFQSPRAVALTTLQSNGVYRGIAMVTRTKELYLFAAYDVFDYEIDIPE